MRIEPRSSLTIQLIHKAEFGPGRFEPSGPRLRLTSHDTHRPHAERAASIASVADAVSPVQAKPDPRPADTHRCDARLAPPCPALTYAPASGDVPVTRVIETTVLPSHLVGALLDVLA